METRVSQYKLIVKTKMYIEKGHRGIRAPTITFILGGKCSVYMFFDDVIIVEVWFEKNITYIQINRILEAYL